MILRRIFTQSTRQCASVSRIAQLQVCRQCASPRNIRPISPSTVRPITNPIQWSSFHTTAYRRAQSPTADELMENLEELYGTAKDEFEIAADETEKKTVYAQGDREAAREALTVLKDTFEKSIRESDPEVAKELTRRAAQRIRELEHAVIAMEESALEE